MSDDDKRQEDADNANKEVIKALDKLCGKFCDHPTLFLEEKHLHNEFDRILKEIVPEKEQVAKTGDESPIEFPLIMNEYTTVHHYSRKDKFAEILDKNEAQRGRRISAGSLDYVWLWDKWVKERCYCTAVNKDVRFRSDDTARYLVIVEFKFRHFAEYCVTTDKKQHLPRPTSINAALATMKEEMQSDLNKVCNEKPPFGHIVYFNSKIPLPKKKDDASNSEEKPPTSVEGVFKALKPPQSLDGRQIKLWYAQGGVKTRFKEPSDYYTYPPETSRHR